MVRGPSEDESEDFIDRLQHITALVIAGVLTWMAYLSLSAEYTLTWPGIFGLLSLIILLLYGPVALESLIIAWRKGG